MQAISTNFKTYQQNVWKLGNKNVKLQSYLERLTGEESEKLNRNVVGNPKNRYRWWHRKKRIMNDNSSLIIAKKIIQIRPRDYHQVLVMLDFRWRYAREIKIENAASVNNTELNFQNRSSNPMNFI